MKIIKLYLKPVALKCIKPSSLYYAISLRALDFKFPSSITPKQVIINNEKIKNAKLFIF